MLLMIMNYDDHKAYEQMALKQKTKDKKEKNKGGGATGANLMIITVSGKTNTKIATLSQDISNEVGTAKEL